MSSIFFSIFFFEHPYRWFWLLINLIGFSVDGLYFILALVLSHRAHYQLHLRYLAIKYLVPIMMISSKKANPSC